MSIKINQNACIGCGRCLSVCPGNLIRRGIDGKANIKHPEDCWGCTSCIKECNNRAIAFFLGSDIGGRGSVMHTENSGDICTWVIEEPSGKLHRIEIDRKNANQY